MALTKLKKGLNDYVNSKMIEVSKDLKTSINYANNELYNEATNMFDYYIKKFYEHKTTSYIRDYEFLPGTKTGSYLYNGKYNGIIKTGSWNKPILIINPKLFGNNMPSRRRKYEYNTPYEVMQNIIQGVRFTNDEYRLLWHAPAYKGKYFEYYGGFIKNAYDLFNKKFDSMSEKIIRRQMKLKGYI